MEEDAEMGIGKFFQLGVLCEGGEVLFEGFAEAREGERLPKEVLVESFVRHGGGLMALLR
jgi:hypothetical protein